METKKFEEIMTFMGVRNLRKTAGHYENELEEHEQRYLSLKETLEECTDTQAIDLEDLLFINAKLAFLEGMRFQAVMDDFRT